MTTRSNVAEFYDYMGRQFAEKCDNCGDCLQACSVFPLTRFADRGPRAVMEKITDLLKGGEVSEEAYDMAFSCNLACGRCDKACPKGLVPSLAFMTAIVKIASAGKEPPPLSYQLKPGSRYSFAKLFSALQARPSEKRWMTRAPSSPEPVDVVLFSGCASAGMPNIVLDIMDILDRMGINFAALAGDEICCGSGPLIWGDTEACLTMGRDFVSNIAAFSPKKAVFFCPGCYMICLGMLPQFMSVPFESYELAQFLTENLDKIPFANPVNKVVALHDSCSVARLGTFEPARMLLRAIPGLTLVEMEHNRENALCCGGLTNINRPEISEPLRRAPLEEAKATAADILATICVGCQESFAPLEDQYPFEVRSYISLVAEAVGVQHEDRFKPLVKAGDASQVLARVRDYINTSDYSLEELERVLPQYLNRFCPKHARLSP